MLKHYLYSEKENKQILKSMGVIIDKREQKNEHIIKWFDDKKIDYRHETLNFGDYSFYVPKNEDLHIIRDCYFTKDICIERKNSTDEIVGNFAQDRNRIEYEFLRHKGKMILMIEDQEFYKNLCKGLYKSNYKPKSAVGTYHSFIDRYDIFPSFIDKEFSGMFIYLTFHYYLRNFLK